MPATYQTDVFHGVAPGTASVWTANGRFHRADTDPTTDAATTGVPIPSSGFNYSWRKQFKLKITGGTYSTISNLRFFSDGVAVAVGRTMYASQVTTYVQATSSDETTKVNAAAGGAVIVAAADAVTYTENAPLVVNSGTVATASATGYGTQDFICLQTEFGTTAVAGTSATRNYSYRVDEV